MIVFEIKKSLKKFATSDRAKSNAWFFKTGKGEYGEGDVFLGVTVPNVRKVVKSFLSDAQLNDATELLQSKYHEERLAGCILMVELFKRAMKVGDEKLREKIYKTYLKNTSRINNWDLVDVSCHAIVGNYLFDKDRSILYKLVKSKSLWERRIAIISTAYFIKQGDYQDTFNICELLLNDKEDLIHKACGWMLREVGKNCGQETLNIFLEKYKSNMPRTMLRYAIEKHNLFERKKFLVK